MRIILNRSPFILRFNIICKCTYSHFDSGHLDGPHTALHCLTSAGTHLFLIYYFFKAYTSHTAQGRFNRKIISCVSDYCTQKKRLIGEVIRQCDKCIMYKEYENDWTVISDRLD